MEIEAADDFVLTSSTSIQHATFTGILSGNATVSDILNVGVEIYRVFPGDSNNPPTGNVPTRVNSPSDVVFASRQSADANMTFSTKTLASLFTTNKSVLNGINPIPNQFTGGEGAMRGTEVEFDLTFSAPLDLDSDHYFFVPQVEVDTQNGEFYWLSAPKPIGADGTPFVPDLQTWIRNEALSPDWLRVGTDITHQGPFNGAFSLEGTAGPVPEPRTLGFMALGLAGLAIARNVKR